MTFNEKKLEEFNNKFDTLECDDMFCGMHARNLDGDVVSSKEHILDNIYDFIEQSLLDKEQEVLERIYGCINIYDQDNVLLVEEVQDKIVKNIKKEFKQ